MVACENVRVACMQDPRRDEMWNNFAYIASCTGGIQRHHKFISKVSEKRNPNLSPNPYPTPNPNPNPGELITSLTVSLFHSRLSAREDAAGESLGP